MTKVSGDIVQLGVTGSISGLGVSGDITQKGVGSSMSEGGYVTDPPLFVSATVDSVPANVIELLFDRSITVDNDPDVNDFVITLTGGAITVQTIQFTATTGLIYLFLSRSVTNGETGTIAYTPTTYPIRSTSTNDAADSFTESITNNVAPSGTVPVFVSAAVANATPTKVVLTYDQTLDTASVPATTDFTVTDHTISSVTISGSTVELTLSTAVIYFDIIYVTYTEGANPIQGDVGELDAADLTSTLITNNVAVTGNEIGWWLASDTATITKDGSNYVSQWNDKLASGRNLLQAAGTNQPLWSSSGITFDGIDNFMKASAFTWNQPEFLILVLKQITWTSLDTFIDGNTANCGIIQQVTGTPEIAAYAGLYSSNSSDLVLDTYGIIRVLFNGASSKFQINNNAAIIGNFGASNMAGFTVGTRGTAGARFSNIQVVEIIGLNTAPSSDYETSLYNAVKRRNGL